jgi:hypothetical protein
MAYESALRTDLRQHVTMSSLLQPEQIVLMLQLRRDAPIYST